MPEETPQVILPPLERNGTEPILRRTPGTPRLNLSINGPSEEPVLA